MLIVSCAKSTWIRSHRNLVMSLLSDLCSCLLAKRLISIGWKIYSKFAYSFFHHLTNTVYINNFCVTVLQPKPFWHIFIPQSLCIFKTHHVFYSLQDIWFCFSKIWILWTSWSLSGTWLALWPLSVLWKQPLRHVKHKLHKQIWNEIMFWAVWRSFMMIPVTVLLD